MIKKIFFIFIISTTIFSADEKFIEGVDFQLINNNPSAYEQKKSKKILVVEAFWYGCPHCYIFDDYLSKWDLKNEKDIEFVNMPVVFNKTWLLHARLFYTIKEMEIHSELHKNFFYAFHEQHRKFSSVD